MQVIWKYFYSTHSSADHGTLHQLRNKVNCTVVTKPSNDFNSCHDFFVLVVSCHIIAATLAMLKMKSMNDTPSEDVLPNALNIWIQSSDERKAILNQ